MTVTRKVLLALVIVSTGYGVGRLLGDPAARRHLPLPESSAAFSHGSSPAALQSPASVARTPRLLPDYAAGDQHFANWGGDGKAASAVADHLAAGRGDPLQPSPTPLHGIAAARPQPQAIARASLRNEAPRPILNDARPPARETLAAPAQPLQLPSPPLEQISIRVVQENTVPFSHDFQSHPVITAAYDELMANTAITLPTTTDDDATAVTRTHIVIDGDSLAKLAGRYLGDPHRGREIYELNRAVLTDPELLPLGAELAIPSRSSRRKEPDLAPQSFVPQAVASHAPPTTGLVPVRPMPIEQVIPRAQLARPMPIDKRD